MNFVQRILQRVLGRGRDQTRTVPARTQSALASMRTRDYFDLLKAYYLNNGLYDEIQGVLSALNVNHEGVKPLRNPAYRATEFYPSTLWLTELQIITKNKRIVEPIQQVWDWSNWASQKQVFARWLAMYGNTWTKVAQSADGERVFCQLIEPQFVTDFASDVRGFMTLIRVDTPIMNGTVQLTHTEVWDKSDQMLRIWEHQLGDVALDQLGTPKFEQPFSAFGIDFVPFVHTKLRDIGDARGVGAFVMALDKIDEANLAATRLHQMLFRNNRVLWALSANATDPNGRPMPPPNVSLSNDTSGTDPFYELGNDRMVRLPGNSSLDSLVPDLNYEAALKILQDQMLEIEGDLPEMAYYRIRQLSRDMSGVAVRLLLTDATSRLLEARNNAEAGLQRLDAMVLTIAANARLKGFTNLGTFENGDFKHSFKPREVIPVSEAERATTIKNSKDSGIPLVTAARRNDWSEDEIAQMLQDQAADDARNFDKQKRAMELQFGTGGN